MSALPVPESPAYHPYRIQAHEGPQTIGELRGALAALSPADVTAFNARLDSAAPHEVPALFTEYRHVWALRSRPEVQAAIAATFDHTEPVLAADDFFAQFGLGEERS